MHFLPFIVSLLIGSMLGLPEVVAANDVLNRLSLIRGDASFTFEYSTTSPHPRNWIGLYNASGGGPDNQQQHVSNALSWAYASLDNGKVKVTTSGLPRGLYKAYFLAKDGYQWITDPIEISLDIMDGSLDLVDGKHAPPLTFSYSILRPSLKHWIGIWYANGGSPLNGQKIASPVIWKYTSHRVSDKVEIDTRGLPPGWYTAYLLGSDGYAWLANPVDFFLPGSPGSVSFLVPTFTTRIAKPGSPFIADISGLLGNAPDSNTKFTKAISSNGGDWIDISPFGILAGIPPSSPTATRTDVTVEATGSNGSKAILQVIVPIQATIDELRVVSFNMWYGGTMVNDYHRKQLQYIVDSGADIVGLQESFPSHSYRLAQALGWHAWQGSDSSIISRYPFSHIYSATDVSVAVRISLNSNENQVIVWNAHLGHNPYGPYDFCFSHMRQEQVMDREAKSGRTPQIQEIVGRMAEMLRESDNTPVLLTGDFNAPSHLDWTKENKHCGNGYVPWPSSKIPEMAGLIDSYRYLHPDPAKDPGITWSPIYLSNEEYGNQAEPADRIDFILYKGQKLKPLYSDAMVIGNPRSEPNHHNNQWPSDHRAVCTVFKIVI